MRTKEEKRARERELEHELVAAADCERQAADLQALLRERALAGAAAERVVNERREPLNVLLPELRPEWEPRLAERRQREERSTIDGVDKALAALELSSPEQAEQYRLELLGEALERYRRAATAADRVCHEEAARRVEALETE